MSVDIYIRPLRETDAEISYRWRNDPEIWKYTLSRPDKEITLEIEKDWIQKVLSRSDEKRFAVCLRDTDEYIGNVQLTDINSYEAEFHIFIGEKKYWGKGLGTKVTSLAVDYAFNVLELQSVYLFVKKENVAAIRAYEKAGFNKIIEDESGNIRLAKYSFDNDSRRTVSVFMMAYNHEEFISQALDGILIQNTDFAVEIVVGEDKSTDKTRSILINYAQKHPNKLKLILHSKNIGANKNQISVLNGCNGKYIAMCEGDDYWTDPHKLQKQVNLLEANPDFSICFHSVKIVFEDENTEPKITNKNQAEITTFENLAIGNYIHTVSCVFRNNLSNLPEWFDKMPAGDYVLHLLNAERGKIGFINEVMAAYRVHKGGAWSMKDAGELYARWVPLVEQCRSHFYPRGADGFTKQLASTYKQLCYANYNVGKYRDFRQNFARCVSLARYLDARAVLNLSIRYPPSLVPRIANLYKSTLKSLRAKKT
jgi:RimJ/RimL family protein N-acetyltransferase